MRQSFSSASSAAGDSRCASSTTLQCVVVNAAPPYCPLAPIPVGEVISSGESAHIAIQVKTRSRSKPVSKSASHIDHMIYVVLRSEHRFNAGRIKNFPTPPVRSDFNYRHWSGADKEVEDLLMEYGVLRDSEPGDWVCAGRCLMALEPGRDSVAAAGVTALQLHRLFTTVCGAGLLASSWALTFWICVASSLSCVCASVALKSSFAVRSWLLARTLRCSLRNSLSNIAFTAS